MKTNQLHTRPRSGFAFFSLTLLACFALSLTACKKEVEVINPVPPVDIPTNPGSSATGAVTPVALPEGAVITATIGPAGGTLESADKRIRINVPAGALSSNQTISVQPLNQNHCPLGTGTAFRLLPHGQIFAKPATITFHYTEQDVNGSAPQLLRIAYQNDKGSWQSPATKAIDTTAHTVTVQTTHFSDWGLFQTMEVTPDHAFISPGEEVELNVLVIPVKDYGDDLLVPIPYRAPASLIKEWTLRGEGLLVSSGNQGAYYAPKTISAVNPETVTVFLNQSTTIDGQVFKDLRLVSNIYVIPEGLTFRINGGKWVHTLSPQGAQILTTPAGKLLTISSGVTTAEGNNVSVAIQSLQVPLETQEPTPINHMTAVVMPWVLEGAGPRFSLSDASAKTIYQHFYHVGKVGYPSPGALTFYSFSKVGDYVIGKFDLQKSEAFNQVGSAGFFRIEGYFRVKRTK